MTSLSKTMEAVYATATPTPVVALPLPDYTPIVIGSATTYGLGDIIEVGNLSIVAYQWRKTIEEFDYVYIDFLMVNRGNQQILSDSFGAELKDYNGQKHTFFSWDYSRLDGGERNLSTAIFRVNARAERFFFSLDTENGFFEGLPGVQFTIDLGPNPAAVPIPGPMSGEISFPTSEIGETVQVGTLTFMVNSVVESPGDGVWAPEAGNQYIILDVRVDNQGSEEYFFVPLSQFYLKDAQGRTYPMSHGATTEVGGGLQSSPISPGAWLIGPIGFEVPQDARELTLVFDAVDSGYNQKVYVRIPIP